MKKSKLFLSLLSLFCLVGCKSSATQIQEACYGSSKMGKVIYCDGCIQYDSSLEHKNIYVVQTNKKKVITEYDDKHIPIATHYHIFVIVS